MKIFNRFYLKIFKFNAQNSGITPLLQTIIKFQKKVGKEEKVHNTKLIFSNSKKKKGTFSTAGQNWNESHEKVANFLFYF